MSYVILAIGWCLLFGAGWRARSEGSSLWPVVMATVGTALINWGLR